MSYPPVKCPRCGAPITTERGKYESTALDRVAEYIRFRCTKCSWVWEEEI